MRKLGVTTKVLGGFVAFGALAFAPIEQASAGCGDYLTIGHGPSLNDHLGDSPMKPATTPCNGPNCHRHDGPPLTPAPEFSAAPTSGKAATIVANAAPKTKAVVEHSSDDDVRPLPGFAAPFLRPPQDV